MLETSKKQFLYTIVMLSCRNPSVDYESISKSAAANATLRRLKKSFYTNIPTSYMDYITNKVVPKTGLDFEEEKDIYHVKVFLLSSSASQILSCYSCEFNCLTNLSFCFLFSIS